MVSTISYKVEEQATIEEEPLLGVVVVLVAVGQGVPSILLSMPDSPGRDHRSFQGGEEMDMRQPHQLLVMVDPRRRSRLL